MVGSTSERQEAPASGKLPTPPEKPMNLFQASKPTSSSTMSPSSPWTTIYHSESFRLAARVTTACFLASLFVLCCAPEPRAEYPQGVWVYVTAGVVTWQPTPDVASSLKKAFHRTVGTMLGGAAGLVLGAISLAVVELFGTLAQVIFMAVALVLTNFVWTYLAVQWGYRSHYAAVLGNLTTGIAMLSFYHEDVEESWKTGVFRIVNITLGGMLGSIATLVVFPVSTQHYLETKVAETIQETGKAAKLVLANVGEKELTRYDWFHHPKDILQDEAHETYMKSDAKLDSSKSVVDLLDYDPTFLRLPTQQRHELIQTMNVTLGRIQRMQASILILDSLIRSRSISEDYIDRELCLEIGDCIETIMASMAHPMSKGEDPKAGAAEAALLHIGLPKIRQAIVYIRKMYLIDNQFGSASEEGLTGQALEEALSDFEGVDVPDRSRLWERRDGFFYRNLELLILRCIRLHRLRTITKLYLYKLAS